MPHEINPGQVFGLCGRWFVLVMPPGEDDTARDKLCGDFLMLPVPPDEPAQS